MQQIYANQLEEVSDEMRFRIACLVNCVGVLQREFCFISKESIWAVYCAVQELEIGASEVLSQSERLILHLKNEKSNKLGI